MQHHRLTLTALLVAACNPTDTEDDSGDPSTGDDTSVSDDTGGGSDDTGTTGGKGTTGQTGDATASVSAYEGTEDWWFLDESSGDLCRIRYTLTSTAIRDDCTDCAFAFDLVLSDAQVVAESGVGCLSLAGYDSTTVSQMDGTAVSYGYHPDYFGHAQVLMVDSGTWEAAAFATWDESSGAFEYEIEGGFFKY